MPKGVVLTHGNLIADAAGCLLSGIIALKNDDVHLSYLPLAHMFERMVFFLVIHAGARAGFFRGVINFFTLQFIIITYFIIIIIIIIN